MEKPAPIAEVLVQQNGDVIMFWIASTGAASWLDTHAPQFAVDYAVWANGKARRLVVAPNYRPEEVAAWLGEGASQK